MMPYLDKSESSLPLFKEYAFDFATNEPIIENGKFVILNGLEAIKVWVYKAVVIERYKYSAFDWQYGVEIEKLVGRADITKEKIEKMLSDALLISAYIQSVSVSSFVRDGSSFSFIATIETIYGEVQINA